MKKLRKALSAPGLLAITRNRFRRVPDHRGGSPSIALSDALMSGLAIFGLKCPSLLQFDQQRRDPVEAHNLRTLYGVERAPCDTQMREILDGVDPRCLRPTFKAVFSHLQRGKALESYQYLDGHYLLSIDGTGYFSSSTVHCSQCCVKTHQDGEETYYHQLLAGVLVHPDHREVIPLAPEAITRQDGHTKNDCERNAAKRLLPAIRREHPHLKLIVVEDALAANAPHIKLLKALDMRFILGVKPGDHKALFAQVEEKTCREEVETWAFTDEDEVTHRFRAVNGLSLNEAHPDVIVNFLEYWEERPKKVRHFTWITDFFVSKDNAFDLSRGGRARWKIENETLNTLKNQGYHFEHNYGHGQKYLATVFSMLMMLAFLIDQVQALCCPLFQQAHQRQHSKIGLWEKMRSLFRSFRIESWEVFFLAMIKGHGLYDLTPDTS